MELPLTPEQEQKVLEALGIGDEEGPIEQVFVFHPTATRDDVVDTVEALEVRFHQRGWWETPGGG